VKLFLAVFLTLLLCLAPLLAQKRAVTDDRIVDQVRMRLVADADVKGGALDIQARNGVVTLVGRVDTDKARHRAERLARKVKGVKAVNNNLVVGPR
jgi:hyperosmotically inducible periplasmic protein